MHLFLSLLLSPPLSCCLSIWLSSSVSLCSFIYSTLSQSFERLLSASIFISTHPTPSLSVSSSLSSLQLLFDLSSLLCICYILFTLLLMFSPSSFSLHCSIHLVLPTFPLIFQSLSLPPLLLLSHFLSFPLSHHPCISSSTPPFVSHFPSFPLPYSSSLHLDPSILFLPTFISTSLALTFAPPPPLSILYLSIIVSRMSAPLSCSLPVIHLTISIRCNPPNHFFLFFYLSIFLLKSVINFYDPV